MLEWMYDVYGNKMFYNKLLLTCFSSGRSQWSERSRTSALITVSGDHRITMNVRRKLGKLLRNTAWRTPTVDGRTLYRARARLRMLARRHRPNERRFCTPRNVRRIGKTCVAGGAGHHHAFARYYLSLNRAVHVLGRGTRLLRLGVRNAPRNLARVTVFKGN